MEQKDTPEQHGPQLSDRAESRAKIKNTITILIVLLFVLASLGALYWQHKKTGDLSKENENLSTQLADLRSSDSSGIGNSKTEAVYHAEVGKFTLTLPDKYVVVQRNDGGGEGGSATILLIGDETTDNGVVISSIYSEVSITATKLQGSTFREHVDSELSQNTPATKLDSLQIDGVSAEAYHVGGLASPRVVYFSKGDLVYKIYLFDDSNEEPVDKLDAIVAGFKFD